MAMTQDIIWLSPQGTVIACVEKNKVLRENLVEIQQVCQDALDDAVLMGCDEEQFRSVLAVLVEQLHSEHWAQE
ncbi:MAG: hypothetical protein WAO71_14755 [Gallionella sp.]